jgi:hypothetical protein
LKIRWNAVPCFERHPFLSGESFAVPNVVRNIDKVARRILGRLNRLVRGNPMRTLAGINGRSGLINFLEIVPRSVLAIDTKGEQIRAILHPEKLSRLLAMSPNDVGTAIRSRVLLGKFRS